MLRVRPEYILDLDGNNYFQGNDYRIAKVSIDPLIGTSKDAIAGLIKGKVNKLSEYSHLFVLVIDVLISNARVVQSVDWLKVLHDTNNIIIIEIRQESKLLQRIYKDTEEYVSDDFKENNYETDDDDLGNKVTVADFKSFIEKNCEDKSLLDCETHESEYATYVDHAAQQNDSVLMSLLKVFVPKKYFDRNVLKNLVICSNVQTFMAYLDLPLQNDRYSVVSLSKYEDNKTLLCIAAEERDTDMVSVLLRLGADVESKDLKKRLPADYALRKERYLNLKILLENDAPFTYDEKFKSFGESVAEEKLNIWNILEERRKLHQAVKDNDEGRIKKFRENHPNLKFAYFFTKAVFTTACEQNSINACATLLTENFCIHKSQVDTKMNDSMKQSITTYMQNKFQRNDCWHILFLEANTKIGFKNDRDDYREHFKRINGIYKRLSRLKEVDDLLKIIEHSESFSITFDFSNKFVGNVDLMTGRLSKDGLCYHNRGLIFVGAASDDDTIAGVVAHEITHFALQIMFANNCKPYFAHDYQQQKVYEDIVQRIENLRDNVEIVKDVFKYKGTEEIKKELIVRVTQLIALDQKNILLEKYSDLFQFFHQNVSNRAAELVRNPETFRVHRGVQQLNEKLGHIEEMKKFKIQLKNSRVKEISNEIYCQAVTCRTPRLFLYDFYNQHNTFEINAESNFIYASVQDLSTPLKLQQILRIWDLMNNIILVLNCENLSEEYSKPFKYLKKRIAKRIIAFGSEEEISIFWKLTTNSERGTIHSVQYEWDDIQEDYRKYLMDTEISFQGVSVRLSSIGCPFEIVPMEKVVNGEKIMIDRSTVVNDHYDPDEFVNRTFESYGNFDDFLVQTIDNKALLLSGDAGIGKSIILTHISLQLKIIDATSYVIRVNLHEHVKAFMKSDFENSDSALKFVIDNFLQSENSTDMEFTRKLFAYCYHLDKVIVLVDAVDEIAPTCLRQCLHLISLLCEGKVRLWITTRKHLDEHLTSILEQCPSFKQIYLRAFTMNDRLLYITKFWRKKLKVDGDERKLFEFADKVTDGLDSIFEWEPPTVGIPLLITMIAVIYLDDAENYIKYGSETQRFEIIDLFGLFTAFITKKIHTMVKDKGEIVEKEKGENEIFGLDVIALHEKLALKSMFQNSKTYKHLYTGRTCLTDVDSIQRYGLVTFDVNGEHYFMHDTIAEYFVATYISKTLKNFAKIDDFPVYKVKLAIVAMNEYAIANLNIQQQSLLSFVNGCFGIFFNKRMEKIIAEKCSMHSLVNHKIIGFLIHLIIKDAVFISHLYLQYIINSELLGKLFEEDCLVFYLASRSCVSYIVESFATVDKVNEKVTKEFYLRKFYAFNAFQEAFLHFPEKETDFIRDCSSYNELKEVLLQKRNLNQFLHRTPVELFQYSTLFHHIQIIKLKLKSTDDEIKSLLEAVDNFNRHFTDRPYFCEPYFRKALEMKWIALNELLPAGYTADWSRLMTTLFRNVVDVIFYHQHDQQNMVVMIEFYKFVKDKYPDKYPEIVEETFISYICRCQSNIGTDELFSFIREEISLNEALKKNVEKIRDSSEMMLGWGGSTFPIIQKHFTEEEFKIILFHKNEDCEDHFVSEIFKNETVDILTFLDAIKDSAYVQMDEFKKFCRSPIAFTRLCNSIWKQLGNGSSDIYLRKFYCNISAVNNLTIIEKSVDRNVIRNALQTPNSNGESVFEVAAKQRDFMTLRKVWCMAKNVLSKKELKDILMKEGSTFSKMPGMQLEQLDEPPGVNNTHCKSACYEYVPFKPGQVIPENVMKVNQKYIGVMRKRKEINEFGLIRSMDDHLCEIVPHNDPLQWQITTIGYESELGERLNNDIYLELLVGKGFNWSEIGSTKEEEQFSCSIRFLMKDVNDQLSSSYDSAHTKTRSYLIFDDHCVQNSGNCIYSSTAEKLL